MKTLHLAVWIFLAAGTMSSGQESWELIGGRKDKNAIGQGGNVAVYIGPKQKVFFATHELGEILHIDISQVEEWQPQSVKTSKAATASDPHYSITWFVTRNDVLIARIDCSNPEEEKAKQVRLIVRGDCRQSFDWRGKPGGMKQSERIGDTVVLTDANVFPQVLPHGLTMAIGSIVKPAQITAAEPGTYQMRFDSAINPLTKRSFTLACAIHPDPKQAHANLAAVLQQRNPIGENRKEWAKFYQHAIPSFTCSNAKLNELYAFRWFLLRFSTAGGNLGYFKYPVVMEGRQAYQTYCCYSAPFMAFDLNWANDAQYGFGHIANLIHAQYEDGRFPWYTSPRTNKVPLHHASASGLSLMPWAAWKHYLVHGDKKMLADLYPGMKKNMQWWIADRDPQGTGLFQIDDQLETGMDDLFRWSGKEKPKRYEAIDASCYAYLNLRAVELMARELGLKDEEKYFHDYAASTQTAINRDLWDTKAKCWKDRNPQSKELANYICITAFYPFFAGVAEKEQLSVLREYLLNPDRFWLPYPVPALPRDHPQFDPNGFWQGPSWPAATSHVVEGFATTAKRLDRSLLPEAGQLFLRAANVHMTPRADFYERYNPLTGQPLSKFKDYMHSWWIDNIIRHAAGVMLEDDGRLVIDPLPLGLEQFKLDGVKWRGKVVDVAWSDPELKSMPMGHTHGLTVKVDGKVVVSLPKFQPGQAPVEIK